MSSLLKANQEFNQKFNQKSKMSSQVKVYDANMSDHEKKQLDFKEVEKKMESERMSLTCAPGGENNRGMEIIGRMPIKGEGFTADDIEKLGPYFEDRTIDFHFGPGWNAKPTPVAVLDLNALSLNDTVNDLGDDDQARVLLLRNYIHHWHGDPVEDVKIYEEISALRWDAEYLDPNKYRTEIVDGKEIKVRGKPMNKRARTNLCFVAGREQPPAVLEGKGTIYDLNKMEYLNEAVERLRKNISAGLIAVGSKTKVIINVVEGNRYYDLKNTGIGFHGDTERVVVICLSIGGFNYPMRWQWFKDAMPVGEPIDIFLNSGDVYIMSEKAVGCDWKLRSKYTLRHAAGAEKYTSLKKWHKKRPEYEAKLKAKAEKQSIKAAFKKATIKEKSPPEEKKKAPVETFDEIDAAEVLLNLGKDYEFLMVDIPHTTMLPDETVVLGKTHREQWDQMPTRYNTSRTKKRPQGKIGMIPCRISTIQIGIMPPKSGYLESESIGPTGKWLLGEKIGAMPKLDVTFEGFCVSSGLYRIKKNPNWVC